MKHILEINRRLSDKHTQEEAESFLIQYCRWNNLRVESYILIQDGGHYMIKGASL